MYGKQKLYKYGNPINFQRHHVCTDDISVLIFSGRKQKLLKYGNLIVPQICLLPKTQHDPNSFIVDVSYTSVGSTFVGQLICTQY